MTEPDAREVQRAMRAERQRASNRLSKLKQRALKMGLNLRDFYAAIDSPPLCEGCGAQTTLGEQVQGTDLTFDHDHRTGRFRGFLCRRCNLVLGQVDDDPDRLRQLAAYVDASRA